MKKNWKDWVARFVLISFIVPMGYIIYKIIVSPTSNVENIEGLRVKTDYILMLLQCILGVVAMLIPKMISKKAKIEIPSNMYFLFVIFLYMRNIFGGSNKFLL